MHKGMEQHTNKGGKSAAKENIIKELARLARQTLAIQASSATSERVFSSAGNIYTVRRTNLSVSKMEQLVFMKENNKLLDEIPDLKWQVTSNFANTES